MTLTLPGDNTRILLQGDVHGNTAAVTAAIRTAREKDIDTVIQLGDFWCYDSSKRRKSIEYACAQEGVHFFFLAGNHENYPFLESYERAESVDITEHLHYVPSGTILDTGLRRILIAGGAVSVDKRNRTEGVDWWPQEIMNEADLTACLNAGDCDIMLSHDVPDFVPVIGKTRFSHYPDDVVAEANEYRKTLTRVADAVKPLLIAHGHHHKKFVHTTERNGRPVTSYCLDKEFTHSNLAMLDCLWMEIDYVDK